MWRDREAWWISGAIFVVAIASGFAAGGLYQASTDKAPAPMTQAEHQRWSSPDKGDAQICVINSWLRANVPDSPFLPENGWDDGRGYRCPDEPKPP